MVQFVILSKWKFEVNLGTFVQLYSANSAMFAVIQTYFAFVIIEDFIWFSESKSQSNSFNHVSSSLLVNSLSTSSNNTSVVNSVSTNSIGNPSIPPAPLINNLITNNCVTESNTSSTASATNNSSVITSLSVSSAPSQVIAVNSNGDSSKVDGSLTVVMNGPTNTVGSFHQVRLY